MASMPQLIEAICRADSGALATLFDQQIDRVYGIALSMLRCRQEAEDVCSEVFEKIWRRAEAFEPERGSVESWVGAITRNACLDCLRRRARNPEVPAAQPEDGALANAVISEAGPDQWAEHAAFRRAAATALHKLSEGQRRVVGLAVIQGLTHQEIAQRLRMPLGTVKSHCRRGLSAMRVSLNRYDPARE